MKAKAIYPDIDGVRTNIIENPNIIAIQFGESLIVFEDGSSKRHLTFFHGDNYFVLSDELKGKLRAYLNKS